MTDFSMRSLMLFSCAIMPLIISGDVFAGENAQPTESLRFNGTQAVQGVPPLVLDDKEIDALAESLRNGTSPEALAILEELGTQENRRALHVLGELYSKGPLPIDGAKAVDYFMRGADAGENAGYLRLGDLYREGTQVNADPVKALHYYRKAVDKGNSTAKLRLGSALISGSLGETDMATGLNLLEEIAENENRWALYTLGEAYRKGPAQLDGEKAITYHMRAAVVGHHLSLTRLGDIYRDGQIVEADPAKAIAFYKEAIAEGQDAAGRTLAMGHIERRFGSLSKPAEGMKLLEGAVAAGDQFAKANLGNAYLNGTGVSRDPQHGLKLLREAADAGNASAARSLIAALRNGKGKMLSPDLRKAEAEIQKYASLLNEADLALETLLLRSARASSTKEFEALTMRMNELPAEQQQRMLTSTLGANKNAYTWLVQARLAELGVYKAPLNGIMNTRTIRAVAAFCAQHDMMAQCAKGPLHWQVASALSKSLYN